VVKRATERKHLTDLIKMIAYQAESDLFNVLQPHYRCAEQEGRTLLHELLAATGDIQVTHSELQITFAPLSSPHRRAPRRPSVSFSIRPPLYPGSALRLRFAVDPPPCLGSVFPGFPSHRSTVSGPVRSS
jgi:hypothetical protein